MRTEDIVLEALVKWWNDQNYADPYAKDYKGNARLEIELPTAGGYERVFYDLRDLAREITFELERNS